MCSYVFTIVPSSYMFFLQMPCKLLLRYCASSKCCWQESPCTLSWGSFAEALSGSDVRDWVLALTSKRFTRKQTGFRLSCGFLFWGSLLRCNDLLHRCAFGHGDMGFLQECMARIRSTSEQQGNSAVPRWFVASRI